MMDWPAELGPADGPEDAPDPTELDGVGDALEESDGDGDALEDGDELGEVDGLDEGPGPWKAPPGELGHGDGLELLAGN